LKYIVGQRGMGVIIVSNPGEGGDRTPAKWVGGYQQKSRKEKESSRLPGNVGACGCRGDSIVDARKNRKQNLRGGCGLKKRFFGAARQKKNTPQKRKQTPTERVKGGGKKSNFEWEAL